MDGGCDRIHSNILSIGRLPLTDKWDKCKWRLEVYSVVVTLIDSGRQIEFVDGERDVVGDRKVVREKDMQLRCQKYQEFWWSE